MKLRPTICWILTGHQWRYQGWKNAPRYRCDHCGKLGTGVPVGPDGS